MIKKHYEVHAFPAINNIRYYTFYFTAFLFTLFRSFGGGLVFELKNTKINKYIAYWM